MALEKEAIIVQASAEGRTWQTLARIPRNAFGGDPTTVRLGKMGIPAHDTDFNVPGPPGRCTVGKVRVMGGKGG